MDNRSSMSYGKWSYVRAAAIKKVKIRPMCLKPHTSFLWNLLFIDLFILDNFHILYHNVINMSWILLISQKDKTNVDVFPFLVAIYQYPRTLLCWILLRHHSPPPSPMWKTETDTPVSIIGHRLSDNNDHHVDGKIDRRTNFHHRAYSLLFMHFTQKCLCRRTFHYFIIIFNCFYSLICIPFAIVKLIKHNQTFRSLPYNTSLLVQEIENATCHKMRLLWYWNTIYLCPCKKFMCFFPNFLGSKSQTFTRNDRKVS